MNQNKRAEKRSAGCAPSGPSPVSGSVEAGPRSSLGRDVSAATPQEETMKVYVVAWEYDGGGGFDWYVNRPDAVAAYRKEQENECDPGLHGWKAVMFEVEVSSREKATEEIEEQLPDLYDAALALRRGAR